MTMADAGLLGETGDGEESSTGGGGGISERSSRVSVPPVEVVEFIHFAVQELDGLAEYPVLAEDGSNPEELLNQDIPERYVNALEPLVDVVDTLSFEDFFGVDLSEDDYLYLGTAPRLNQGERGEYEELDDDEQEVYTDGDIYVHGDEENGFKKHIVAPEFIEDWREDKFDTDSITDANKVLSAFFLPETAEHLSEEQLQYLSRLFVSIGKSRNNDTELERHQNVSFYIQDGSSTDERTLRAMREWGLIDEEAAEEFMEGELAARELIEMVEEERDL